MDVSLQHSYTSTEEYGADQADQARLLDLLAMELRRSVPQGSSTTPYTMDPDGQGLKITVGAAELGWRCARPEPAPTPPHPAGLICPAFVPDSRSSAPPIV